MYLRTPKRYTAKGRRRYLFNFKWLWLYLLAPVILLPAVLLWDYRGQISDQIGKWANQNVNLHLNPPTATPIIPVTTLKTQFETYRLDGHLKNAIEMLASLADASPNDLEVHTLLVQMRALRGGYGAPSELDPVVQDAQRAVNADPEKPQGWIALALALDKNGKPQQALINILHAQDFYKVGDKLDPMLLAVRAEIENDLEQYDKAKTDASDAVKQADATTQNLIAVAYAHWVNGIVLSASNGSDATKEFEKAWAVVLSDTQHLVPAGFIVEELASIYLNTNREKALIDVLTRAGELDKDNPMVPLLLGRVYYKNNDNDKARTYFSQCLDLSPKQLKCLRWLGQLLYAQDNFVEAAKYEQQAIDQGTTEPEAYLLAGLAYVHLPQPDCVKGVPILQKGLTVNDKSDATDARKASLKTQMMDGLHICNPGLTGGSNTNTPVPVAVPTRTPTPHK